MNQHESHIQSQDLKSAYLYLLDAGRNDNDFQVVENNPLEKGNKRHVAYHYKGEKRRHPFSFIVNTGSIKDYHLFYIRFPSLGNEKLARKIMGDPAINVNTKKEITIQIKNRADAEKVWDLAKKIQG